MSVELQKYFAYASINGNITPLQDAKISLADRGLLFGQAVFETFLVKQDHIIGWDEHYQRLLRSCQKSAIHCPKESILRDYSFALVKYVLSAHTHAKSLNLKLILTAGSNLNLKIYTNQNIDECQSNIYLICQSVIALSDEERFHGFKVQSFLDERGTFFKEIKSTNYLFNLIVLNQAKQNGYDDAILRDENNNYTEGVTSGFLWFNHKHEVFSSPPAGHCLASTSIATFEQACAKSKIQFKYQILNKNQTTNCAGCAFVSSVRGLVPIRQIDDLSFDVDGQIHFFKQLIEILNSCA